MKITTNAMLRLLLVIPPTVYLFCALVDSIESAPFLLGLIADLLYKASTAVTVAAVLGLYALVILGVSALALHPPWRKR